MPRCPDFRPTQCAAGRDRVRRSSLLIVLVSALGLPVAHAIERAGDAQIAKEIRHYATAVTTVQGDLLSAIETASGEKRFNLYRTYNHSIGTWTQVDFLQTLLELSIEQTSASVDQETQRALREQASFTLWELGQNIDELETAIAENRLLDDLRLHEFLRSLLSEVRIIVTRLLSQP